MRGWCGCITLSIWHGRARWAMEVVTRLLPALILAQLKTVRLPDLDCYRTSPPKLPLSARNRPQTLKLEARRTTKHLHSALTDKFKTVKTHKAHFHIQGYPLRGRNPGIFPLASCQGFAAALVPCQAELTYPRTLPNHLHSTSTRRQHFDSPPGSALYNCLPPRAYVHAPLIFD